MKRLVFLLLALILLVSMTSCGISTRQDRVLESLGEYDTKQIWTHGGFQDYTDFGIYTYSSISIRNNRYFTKVSETDMETIGEYIDNFEQWIETFRTNDPNDELVQNYAFDRSTMDLEDYFYLYENEKYQQFSCYDLWFFDSQTKVMYYFHNNI